MDAVFGTSTSSHDPNVTILLAAAGAALAWVALLMYVAWRTRVPDVHAGPVGLDLVPEPPAVAGLLCHDFTVPAETAPAIVLDLAARRVLTLDEVQPGATICRLRSDRGEPLTAYERRVLGALRERAIDGVVPTAALTTGPEEQSRRWHRGLAQEVVADAQQRGLTVQRWPRRTTGMLGTALTPVIALVVLAFLVGGDDRGTTLTTAYAAGALALAVLILGYHLVARLARSLAQLPTAKGYESAARCRGLQQGLRENPTIDDLPPAAVRLWDRLFAYAAAMGVAHAAVEALPMGTEDDHRAWSRAGNQWRRVRVHYPRVWPPAWGRQPAIALLEGLVVLGLSVVALYGIASLADSDRPASWSTDAWDAVQSATLIALVPVLLALAWAIVVLVGAVPDCWRRRTLSGVVVRSRRKRRWSNDDNAEYWYYLAIDPGSSGEVRALRVRPELWNRYNQGDDVVAEISPYRGYVWSMENAPTSPDTGQPSAQLMRSSG